MSEFSLVQIPKPRDEQAFERGNEILWRFLLNDPTAKLYGRRGQKQYGVDIVGNRDQDPNCIVGIQCRLKGEGKFLTEGEISDEVEKALKFEPPLSEYIIATTAPDDAKLDRVAHELSIASSKGRAKNIKIQVSGWGTLEREIARFPEAQKAFNPTHTPMVDNLEEKIDFLPDNIGQTVSAALGPEFSSLHEEIRNLRTIEPVIRADTVYSEQEKQINDCIEIIDTNPESALLILRSLEQRITESTPKGIEFKVKTNIAACQLKLGKESVAADGFIEVWKTDPERPKAISNKAFGLLLKGNLYEARAFAETQLTKHPDNAALAACYIHSLVDDEAISDPLSKIPKATRDSPEVAEAHIQWLIKRGGPGSWWDAAIAAYTAHSNNEELKELYANALLDRILGGGPLQESCILTGHKRVDAMNACSIFESKWKKYNQSSRYARGNWPAIAINLMLAHRILGDTSRALEIGVQALECFPDDPIVKEYVATIFADQGKFDQAIALIDGLEPNLRNVGLQFNIAYSKGDWSTVIDIVDKHLDHFPAKDRNFVFAAQVRASAEIAPAERREKIFSERKDEIQGNVRALIILSEGARIHGLVDLAENLFNAAKLAFQGGDANYVCRLSIAQEAMARRQPKDAAEILIDHLPLDQFSDELVLLGEALVLDLPIRERALRFFENLDPKIRHSVTFQKLEGILHYNRGVPQEAVKSFSPVYLNQPTIENFLRLVQANLVSREKDAVADLLQEKNLDKLPGTPRDRVKLSQLLLEFGHGTRALECGYQALVDGLDDEDVVLKYFGLILSPSHERPDAPDQSVGVGTWVHLTSKMGEDYEVLIGEAEPRPWGDKADIGNPFISKALGLQLGETFENVNGMTGEKQQWRVAEVKPRWLQAFHYLSNNFMQRFPDAAGFSVIKVLDDDIEPVLEQVRRRSDWLRKRADLYLENSLPISVISGNEPGAEVGFHSYLISINRDLRVCLGTATELKKALDSIQENNQRGAVLDAFTAWHAAGLGVLSILQDCLGPLAIPTSELQILRAMVEEINFDSREESMGLAYENGKYVRHLVTAEEREENSALMRSRISTIETICSQEPEVAPDTLPESAEALLKSPIGNRIMPAILAGTERLYLSEDMMMRRLAETAIEVNCIWLQVVLSSAFEGGKMTLDAYTDAVLYLAAGRHAHVALTLPVLLSAFEREANDDIQNLNTLARYIGISDADFRSHIELTAGFINAVSTERPREDFRTLKAINLMFHSLLYDKRGDEWQKWITSLYFRLSEYPKTLLERWCRGHFLPFEEITSVSSDT